MIINDTAMISWQHIITRIHYNNTCRYLQIRQFNMASYLFRCEHMASILIAIHHGSRQPNSSRYKNQVVSGVKFLQLCDNLLISILYIFLTKSTCTMCWIFGRISHQKPLKIHGILRPPCEKWFPLLFELCTGLSQMLSVRFDVRSKRVIFSQG